MLKHYLSKDFGIALYFTSLSLLSQLFHSDLLSFTTNSGYITLSLRLAFWQFRFRFAYGKQ